MIYLKPGEWEILDEEVAVKPPSGNVSSGDQL